MRSKRQKYTQLRAPVGRNNTMIPTILPFNRIESVLASRRKNEVCAFRSERTPASVSDASARPSDQGNFSNEFLCHFFLRLEVQSAGLKPVFLKLFYKRQI